MLNYRKSKLGNFRRQSMIKLNEAWSYYDPSYSWYNFYIYFMSTFIANFLNIWYALKGFKLSLPLLWLFLLDFDSFSSSWSILRFNDTIFSMSAVVLLFTRTFALKSFEPVLNLLDSSNMDFCLDFSLNLFLLFEVLWL